MKKDTKEIDYIYKYTRENAIEDGVLIDVTSLAKDAGFKWPVALTSAVWTDCVEWSQNDGTQDETGRLWDVLFMGFLAIRKNNDNYLILRIKNKTRVTRPSTVGLQIVAGPGDNGEPVITIMFPDES
jgi:hypothetical protein